MKMKPYVLFGAVASTAITLSGCRVAGDEMNVFSADSAAYTQDEIQMMVAGILRNYIEQPRLSAEKDVKYQLGSDISKPKDIDVAAQFAYKLSSEETLQSLMTNYENGEYGYVYDGSAFYGPLTEVQTSYLNDTYQEHIKNSNQVLDKLIEHIGNALSADVVYEENGNVKVTYNVSNYIQEMRGEFDESLVYVKVHLNKDYSLLSANEVVISEVGEEIVYMSYDISENYKGFK